MNIPRIYHIAAVSRATAWHACVAAVSRATAWHAIARYAATEATTRCGATRRAVAHCTAASATVARRAAASRTLPRDVPRAVALPQSMLRSGATPPAALDCNATSSAANDRAYGAMRGAPACREKTDEPRVFIQRDGFSHGVRWKQAFRLTRDTRHIG